MSAAMRRVSRYWFLAASKLMCMQWEWSDAVPYGATDGRTLLLNKAGLEKLCQQPDPTGLIAFLLVHEALHALLGHGWRLARMTQPNTANIAADYVINAMIAERNRELGKVVFPFIEGTLLDESLSGNKSVEQLYRELLKGTQPPTPQSNDTSNDEQQESTDPDASGDSGSPTPSDDPSAGDPVAGDSADAGEGANDLSDFVGKGGKDCFEPAPDNDETLAEAIAACEEANERVLLADAIDRKTSGASDSTGQRVADQRIRTQVVDWSVLLREWLLRSTSSGWNSPYNHVLYQCTKLVGAGRRARAAGTIVLVLDSSGSVGAATYTKFMQQAQAILDELKPEQLILLSVAHHVADSLILEAGQQVPDRLKGGGGTLFQPAFDWLAARHIEPDVMVYLTDGWSSDLGSLREPNYPLLWLSTSRRRADYKVGEVIEINDF